MQRPQGPPAQESTCTGPSEVCEWFRGELGESAVLRWDQNPALWHQLNSSCLEGGGMLPMTPRTPSPPPNMEVETLCFGGFFLLRGEDNCTPSKGRWTGSCTVRGRPGHWKWVMDRYSSMTMTQNTRPRQQRNGSRRSTLRSWSGLASLQTLIP